MEKEIESDLNEFYKIEKLIFEKNKIETKFNL